MEITEKRGSRTKVVAYISFVISSTNNTKITDYTTLSTLSNGNLIPINGIFTEDDDGDDHICYAAGFSSSSVTFKGIIVSSDRIVTQESYRMSISNKTFAIYDNVMQL